MMDTETNFISREIYMHVLLHNSIWTYVSVLERKRKVSGYTNVIKERRGKYVGYECALGSAVKPADSEQWRAEKHQEASWEPSRCFMYRSQSVENLIHSRTQNDPCPLRAPGGENWNTNESFVCSDLQHAAPLCSTHDARLLDTHFNHL